MRICGVAGAMTLAVCLPAVASPGSGWIVDRISSFPYPRLARAAGLQGDVTLECRINEDSGVAESCSHVAGHGLLASAVANAAMAWHFSSSPDGPKARLTEPVIMYFEFVLAGKPADNPREEFSFEFPNRARVTSEPQCSDHIPCSSVEYPAKPYGSGPRLVGMGYSPLARSALLQGEVALNCRISNEGDGSVASCVSLTGHPILARDAVACVRRWRFPLGSEPAASEVRIVFRFELREGKTGFSFHSPNFVTVAGERPPVIVD